ncbi:MAG: glycosyltransferase family A protein, partial [Anaerolineae bacterium]
MDKLAKLFFVSALAAVAFFFLAQTSSLKKSRKAGKRINTVVEEKPFVIVIPSYNNEKFCKRNLDSALEQNYHNFRIIYIDDCSTDETYQKAQDVIKASQQGRRVTFIRNEKNRGALFNLYQVIHHCNDEEIIVALDGDDFLAHQEVLSTLNHIYHDPGIWMTYGSFL